MNNLELICYDIRSMFRESPQLEICFWCCEPLRQRETSSSAGGIAFCNRATIPLVDTYLYCCTNCGWWAIRETRIDCELCDGVGDYLLTTRQWSPDDENCRMARCKFEEIDAWQSVLQEPSYWQENCLLSQMRQLFLFGPRRA